MTVYNHEKYVGEAINSVLMQSFQDFEFIILDNGSTDGSSGIIGSFTDSRIVVLHEAKNIQAYWGVEKCFNQAKGKYIAFIGSDDVWSPAKLQIQFEFIKKELNYGLVFTETKMIDANGAVLDWTPFLTAERNMSRHAWLRHFFFFSNCVCWSSCLMLRDLKTPTSYANARFRQLGDLYIWTDALKKKALYICPEVLTYYRQHGENESQKDVDLLHNRSNLESLYILDLYKSLPHTEIAAIFPELISSHQLNDLNKNYHLANLAIEYFPDAANAKSRIMFGLLTIYDLYSNQTIVEELQRVHGFGLPDFYKLTGTGLDISYNVIKTSAAQDKISEMLATSSKDLLYELKRRILWKAKVFLKSLKSNIVLKFSSMSKNIG